MTDHTVWQLARLAECSDPDSLESRGARFLVAVSSAANEILTDVERLGGDPVDAVHETADALVPVYTHDRWQTFVDLGAYDVDTSDYGSADDMTAAAGIALYIIAERLLYALIEEGTE